jgi:hypothetical protein
MPPIITWVVSSVQFVGTLLVIELAYNPCYAIISQPHMPRLLFERNASWIRKELEFPGAKEIVFFGLLRS